VIRPLPPTATVTRSFRLQGREAGVATGRFRDNDNEQHLILNQYKRFSTQPRCKTQATRMHPQRPGH